MIGKIFKLSDMKVCFDLGVVNIFRMIMYKFGIVTGINAVKRLQFEITPENLFRVNGKLSSGDMSKKDRYLYRPFGFTSQQLPKEIDWAKSVLN
ncbi:hypothetical protein DC364_20195, partial [Vibrio vulnificus]